ncbi:transglycosylase SLT domain-containing protein [Nonomuraea sp. NPDC049419]|uniref:aggregation-promoting factor C-terminal-like domain-containing protein n=1 Tax=Nonomuraea sp. NPDC049419 TaxID=3155772 RepID=UPI0034229D25
MPMLRRTGVLVLTATLVAAGGASAAQAQSSQTSGRNKSIARTMVAKRGWDIGQYRCLVKLWTRESGWNHRAGNRSSGAYGIPQALPGHKMAASGRDWRTNPRTQIHWGLGYIKQRYKSPCRAWGHFQSHHWY